RRSKIVALCEFDQNAAARRTAVGKGPGQGRSDLEHLSLLDRRGIPGGFVLCKELIKTVKERVRRLWVLERRESAYSRHSNTAVFITGCVYQRVERVLILSRAECSCGICTGDRVSISGQYRPQCRISSLCS